jgi:hypothetical protein
MNPILTIVLVAAGQAGGEIETSWAGKARSALPGQVERLLQLSPLLDEVHEHTVIIQAEDKAKAAMKLRDRPAMHETLRLGSNLLVKSTTTADDKGQRESVVRCCNGHYNFKLTRKGADGPYVLVSYSNDRPKGDWSRNAHREMLYPMQGLLSALESKDQTVLRRLAWDAGRSLVVAEYDVRHDSRDPKQGFTDRCLFDPARGWAPVEAVRKTWAARFETRFEYGIDVEGLTFPSVIETKASYHVTPAPPAHTIRQAILSLRPTRTTEADYRLSAFGLPEPEDAPPLPRSGLPTYVYILAGSVVCAALSVGIRYLAKRHEK